jgi:uncharacterized protein YbjQ (UPF0145 family)
MATGQNIQIAEESLVSLGKTVMSGKITLDGKAFLRENVGSLIDGFEHSLRQTPSLNSTACNLGVGPSVWAKRVHF